MRTESKVVQTKIDRFRRCVYTYYRKYGRDLPWRRTRNPYRILVSEFMLQQTQVERVKAKYAAFLKAFPSVRALAKATLAEVLIAWQGLGYNRRAWNLKRCAEEITARHGGRVPRTEAKLLSLPGVGPSTAGAVIAFAYNLPAVFIETNIRSVFIHFFFSKKRKVSDRDIEPLVTRTMDWKNPREWYYALFDYGVHLKGRDPGIGKRSAQYKKQSPFAGSRRQARGAVLRLLTVRRSGLTIQALAKAIGREGALTKSVLEELAREGLLERRGMKYRVDRSG